MSMNGADIQQIEQKSHP